MSCVETISAYALRSLGLGERLLPRGTEITLCEQVTLIGSGMIWNVYFGVLALIAGFFLATGLALAKNSPIWMLRRPAGGFIFLFRGSPLFIQFFLAYELFTLLPRDGLSLNLGFTVLTAETSWLTRAWAGACRLGMHALRSSAEIRNILWIRAQARPNVVKRCAKLDPFSFIQHKWRHPCHGVGASYLSMSIP